MLKVCQRQRAESRPEVSPVSRRADLEFGVLGELTLACSTLYFTVWTRQQRRCLVLSVNLSTRS